MQWNTQKTSWQLAATTVTDQQGNYIFDNNVVPTNTPIFVEVASINNVANQAIPITRIVQSEIDPHDAVAVANNRELSKVYLVRRGINNTDNNSSLHAATIPSPNDCQSYTSSTKVDFLLTNETSTIIAAEDWYKQPSTVTDSSITTDSPLTNSNGSKVFEMLRYLDIWLF